MANLATLSINVELLTAQVTSGVGNLVNKLDGLARIIGKGFAGVAPSIVAAQMAMSIFQKVIEAATVSARLLASTLADSVRLAAGMEQTTLGLGAMAGSAAEAQRQMELLQKLSLDTGLGSQVFSIANKLAGAGMEFGRILPTIRMFGNLVGNNADEMGRLVLAYGQVMSAGRLQGDEMRQLGELTGPLARLRQSLADVLHVPVTDLKQMIADGKVSAQQFDLALQKLGGAGGMFADRLEMMKNSTAGLYNQVLGSWEQLKIVIGEILIKGLDLPNRLQDLVKWMQTNIPVIKSHVNDAVASIRAMVQGTETLLKNTVKIMGVVSSSLEIMLGKIEAKLQALATIAPWLSTLLEPAPIKTVDPRAEMKAKHMKKVADEAMMAINDMAGSVVETGAFSTLEQFRMKGLEDSADNVVKTMETIKNKANEIESFYGDMAFNIWDGVDFSKTDKLEEVSHNIENAAADLMGSQAAYSTIFRGQAMARTADRIAREQQILQEQQVQEQRRTTKAVEKLAGNIGLTVASISI